MKTLFAVTDVSGPDLSNDTSIFELKTAHAVSYSDDSSFLKEFDKHDCIVNEKGSIHLTFTADEV